MIEIAKAAEDIWVGTRSEAVKYILARQKGEARRRRGDRPRLGTLLGCGKQSTAAMIARAKKCPCG